jgi:hypothetical protein
VPNSPRRPLKDVRLAIHGIHRQTDTQSLRNCESHCPGADRKYLSRQIRALHLELLGGPELKDTGSPGGAVSWVCEVIVRLVGGGP